MPRHLARQKKHLLALPMSVLVETAGRFLRPPTQAPVRARIYTPWITFWMFLAQVLTRPGTCSEAVSQGRHGSNSSGETPRHRTRRPTARPVPDYRSRTWNVRCTAR